MRCGHFSVVVAVSILGASLSAGDWPQWRGPDRTDVSKETGLLKQWPAGGPKQVWLFKEAGKGYAGFAVAAGKLYTMRATDTQEELIALDAATGKLLWATPIGSVLGNRWGDGPRATPTVDGDRVYALGGQGTLVGVQARDGKVGWKVTMQELGGKTPNWGYTESVLVDGKLVLCTPGGNKGAVAALDKNTGKVVWQSKQFTDGAQYSSIVPADIHGKHQYIQLTMNSFVGLDAANGNVLWKAEWPGKTAVIPTPIVSGNLVYITSGYGVGCRLSRIEKDFKVTTVWDNKNMKNHHGGVILLDGHLYGHSDTAWTCQSLETGEIVWSERKLGKGAVACADGMLYLLEESTGTVALIEASPKAYTERGRFTLEPQTSIRSPQGKVWTHPVIAHGKLYLRDQDMIYCFDVSAKSSASIR
jgi:outer membrane protein assembly factor BamB